jgi:hypothetical protein
MNDLRQHLEDRGLDPADVLPDWWDDDLAEVSTNRPVAEIYVARATGIPVSGLRKPPALPARPLLEAERRVVIWSPSNRLDFREVIVSACVVCSVCRRGYVCSTCRELSESACGCQVAMIPACCCAELFEEENA